MFYEEEFIDGVLHYRTDPNDEFEVVTYKTYIDADKKADNCRRSVAFNNDYFYTWTGCPGGYKVVRSWIANNTTPMGQDSVSVTTNYNAKQLLNRVAKLQEERGKEYDNPEGERSMEKVVQLFNLQHGTNLTEAQGWHFMCIVKDVRLFTKPGYHKDSAEDGISYHALMAEAKQKEA